MEVHNDLIIFVSCQINADIISRLECVDVVKVEEGIMPASKSKYDVERLPACFIVHDLAASETTCCCQVQVLPLKKKILTSPSIMNRQQSNQERIDLLRFGHHRL